MDVEIREGLTVYTADGQKLGKVKEVGEGSDGLSYIHVDTPMLRSNFWLASTWAKEAGEDRLTLDFGKELLNTYKVPKLP